LSPKSAKSAAIGIVRQFQSETDAIREAPEPRWARLTVLVLAALLASLILIMCLFRVDRVITSQAANIVPIQRVNVFQALDPSIIRTIDVREGQRVEKGQLLATLDPTFAAADVKQLQQQIASYETQVLRDEAELERRPPVFPQKADPDFVRYAGLQKALYDQRMSQYLAQVNGYDAKIAQTKATIQKLEGDAGRYQERQDVAEKIEGMRTYLAKSGSGSQLNMLISQDARLELQRNVENTKNSLIEAQHTLTSLVADREAFVQQWFGTLSQDLVTTRNSLDGARAQLDKAARHQDLVRLTANDDSIVLTVAKLSVGSVLKEGDSLFTLMPVNTPLEAEARVASRDIGFVRQGDQCVLKIDAFNFVEHGTADGTVRWISEGAFSTDDNNNQPVEPYYKVRCSIDATHFVNVAANFRLIPGMTLTADINVGSRSLAMYLFSGVLRGVGESMREP
jgi:hemolysin D